MATITFPIEATHILMFARSIGDENPVYHDAEKAKDALHGFTIDGAGHSRQHSS